MGPAAPTEIQRILACLALSPRMIALAGEALALSARLEAELTFVHAGEDTPDTRARLEQALLELAPDRPAPPIVISNGRPDEVICAMAREIDADLVVAGALEREGLIESLLGSVARRIARHAPCSVLLYTDPRPQGRLFREGVASVRFDGESAAMVHCTVDLGRQLGMHTLHIVHEVNAYEQALARYNSPAHADAARKRREWMFADRYKLVNFLDEFDFGPIKLKTAFLEGAEGMESVGYARRHAADLLAFPAPPRRLTFWDRFFHHPAETMLQRLPCALLLYRRRSGR